MIRFKILSVLFFVLVLKLSAQTIKTDLTYLVNPALKKVAKAPVVIILHGYGSNEEDLFDISKSFDPRFTTFSLRAPNTTKEGGFCWYDLEFLPNQQFKYNYDQAKISRSKILSFISNACKAYHLDSTQVFLMGFSQGAIMSYDLALFKPSKIKGVIALSGRLMEESKVIKSDPLQLSKVKFFIAHGYSDNVIKLEESEKANEFFKQKKVTDLIFKKYEMPHSINGQELNDIKAWLIKAINPPEKKEAAKK